MTWKLVLVYDREHGGAQYHPDLPLDELVEFKRAGEDEVQTFSLSEQSPYFNVAGLLWREGRQERLSS
jgi:hypothetical protein